MALRRQRTCGPAHGHRDEPVQSARLNGHDPWAYLRDVLARLPTQLNSRLDELLCPRSSAQQGAERPNMGRLTMEMVARATMEVDALGHDGKVRLGDEVFAAQPNLLRSILVLARMGPHAGGRDRAARPVRRVLGNKAEPAPLGRGDHVSERRRIERLTARIQSTTGCPPNSPPNWSRISAPNMPNATCSPTSTVTAASTIC